MFRRKSNNIISRVLVFLMVMTMAMSLPVSPVVISAEAVIVPSTDDLALTAIRNNYEAYTTGRPVDAGWGNFSAYDGYILMEAGVDISQWEYEDSNMYDDVMSLIDASIANEVNEGSQDQTSAKRLIQDYLAAMEMGETVKAASLLTMLENRQQVNGSFDYNVYSDFPALDMLARIDGLIGSDIDLDSAVENILANQDANGGWPQEYEYEWDGVTYTAFCDFMSTAEAVRVLELTGSYTTVTQEAIDLAINDGMTWLQDKQQDDGNYITGYDDTVTDTSEMIYTAMVLGEDPDTWTSSMDKSPVDYMMDDALVDGSFGNVPSTTWALDAYLQLGASISSDSVLCLTVEPDSSELYSGEAKQLSATAVKLDGSVLDVTEIAEWISSNDDIATVSSSGLVKAKSTGTADIVAYYGSASDNSVIQVDAKPSISSDVQVYIAVIGEDNELLYGPRKVTISEDDEYGDTALGALDATNLDFDFSNDDPGMVDEIDGQKNMGMNGWMYSVNGKVPTVLAGDKVVNSGAKVLWWYSDDPMGESPDWPSSSSFGSTLVVDEDAVKEMLEDYSQELTEGFVLLNEDDMMSASEAEDLEEELEDNDVSLSGDYEGDDLVLSDDELSILVPEGAHDDDIEITVDELDGDEVADRFALRIGSAVYDFGPDGTQFDEPVIISITVPIYEDTYLESLKPAWFDEESGVWITIPCVIDLETGMITFEIDHFTKFAVIETEARVEFSDVNDTMAWARDAIEILAGAGVINGTGDGFEPQRSITRAEFVKIVVEALELEKSEVDGSIFTDVGADDWFAQYVECGYNNGIVTGDPDGSFRPNDQISRNEIAVVLSRLGDNDGVESVELIFDDVLDIPEWARDGVEFAYSAELMNGYEDNTFKGANSLSRAEAAVVVYRYMNYSLNNQ